MANVKDYYPADYYGDTGKSLAWLFARQNAPVGNWQGNAVATPTAPQQLAECGIVSTADLSTYSQTQIENITLDLPVGVSLDNSAGPDNFPINFSPIGLSIGNIFSNTFQNPAPGTTTGRVFNLIQQGYRVDLFVITDKYYYQGSSTTITNPGAGGQATWSASTPNAGAILAVLYPSSVPQPAVGASFTVLPAGYVAHSNTGVGKKLTGYFARIFSKTDIEYLQEDNIPIIVQDSHHARCGSSVIPRPGTITMHIIFNDPVIGPTLVFTSLQNLAAYSDLPRSFTVPPSDPLYVGDVTAEAGVAALQDRSYLYDDALAILAFSASGNFQAAQKIVKRLNFLLDNPGYLSSRTLENGEDGNSASRWSKSLPQDSITDVNDPSQPPYGTGNVVDFLAAVGGDTFTYIGTGFPDTTDSYIFWQHKEPSQSLNVTFTFDVQVTSAAAKVTDIKVKSNPVALSGVAAPAAPSLSQVAGGTLAATTYYVTVTYTMVNGETVPPTEASLAVAANNLLQVASPAAAPGATGWNVYVSTSSGSETRQASPAIGTAWTEPTTGLVNGVLPPASQSFNSATKTIIVPVGVAYDVYRGHLLNLVNLVSTLASDTLGSITGFKITISPSGAFMYFDNFSVGTLQPQNSLSFSYDIYYGQIDQAYIRTGAMAWACYAYALYMILSVDYTPALYLQRMLNFLLTLQSAATDLTSGMFYLGYGKYQDPGYQFVPGEQLTVSTEHQIDAWFALKRAAQVLPTAALQLLKQGTITSAQATSLASSASTYSTTGDEISAQLLSILYTAPSAAAWAQNTAYAVGAQIADSNGNFQKCVVAGRSGLSPPGWSTTLGATTNDGATLKWELTSLAGMPGHFAQGVTGINIDTSQALDASGTWAALFCDAINDDTKATECLKFVYQNFYLTNQQILFSGTVLENPSDGKSSTRWSGSQAADTVADITPDPISGSGTVAYFLAASSGDTFTFIGAGLPDSVSTLLRFSFAQASQGFSSPTFVFDIGITTTGAKVTDVKVTSDPVGLSTFNSSTKTITVPVGPQVGVYRNVLLNLADLVQALASDTFVSIVSFRITLTPAGALVYLSTLETSKFSNLNFAYQQLTKFTGFKNYNDSVGGYSGSPLSAWQEGAWGMILALLRLHDVWSVSSYFSSVQTSIDSFLTTLITSQYTVLTTTGDGSLLGYSLAARSLPWEFEVWPMLAPTAWWWITAVDPAILLSVAGAGTQSQAAYLPNLIIPAGQSQSVNEIDAASSVGHFTVESIDPGGQIKSLAAQQNLIGRIVTLSQGFPGLQLGDFVPLHTMAITAVGFTSDGRLTFECSDIQRIVYGSQLWNNGGPSGWVPGQAAPAQPAGLQWLPNAFACSDQNPRYVQGNPLDILLAALQNELGVGQDPSLPSAGWVIYQPGQPSTLLNPNRYLDIPGILVLRNGPFSGDWFEFKIKRAVEAKQWLEDQILKPLGLYTITRSDGHLALKSMKSPASAAPVMALNQSNTMGIPQLSRLPVINVLTVRMDADDTVPTTAARTYQQEITFKQQTSINQYRYEYKHQVEATGLRLRSGGTLRATLLADRIFRRHAFATPKYKVKAWLSSVPVELGDFVWLNHPLVPDLFTGKIGLNSVVCEVVNRQPNYAGGYMEFELLDTRFMNLTVPYQIAPALVNIPTWTSTTAAQRKQYMFISLASSGGLNPDGTPGNTIF